MSDTTWVGLADCYGSLRRRQISSSASRLKGGRAANPAIQSRFDGSIVRESSGMEGTDQAVSLAVRGGERMPRCGVKGGRGSGWVISLVRAASRAPRTRTDRGRGAR
jgi:hypothetical protein